ncbi:protein BatD [bacterium]|nr:protein BatD [bacterium]
MVKQLFIAIFCSFFIINTANTTAAKEQRFDASVQKTAISMNESVILTLTTYEFEPDSPPQVPNIDGFKTIYRGQSTRGSSSMTIIINGKRQSIEKSQKFIYQYELIPTKTGVFTIPPITARSSGTRYRTNPITITVSKVTKQSQRDVFIETHLSVHECYVEQPVVLDIKWYFSKQISSYSLSIPFMPSFKNFIIKDIDTDILRNTNVQKIQFNDKELDYFQLSDDIYNGVQYKVLTLRKIIVPGASGTFSFEPVTLICDVLKGYKRSQDNFDSFGFFSRRVPITERRVVRSNRQKLVVKSLPAPPADYPDSISVGRYTMTIGASPKKIKVGDPVTLSIVVAGEGNIEAVNEPLVTDKQNFRKFSEDAKSEVSVSAEGIKGKKVFQILLIPTSDKLTQIPPLELAYFDPLTGSYKKRLSRPIPIKVIPAPVSNEPVIIEAQSNQSGKKEVHIVYKDLPGYIKEDLGKTVVREKYIYQKPWYLILFVFPVFFNFAFYLFMKHKRKLAGDVKYRRKITARRRADKIFNNAVKIRNDKKTFYSEIVRGFNEYFGGKFNIPAAGLTIDIVNANLKKKEINNDIIKRVEQIYQNADMARFMPSFNERESEYDIIKKVKEIISLLEKCKW